MHAGDGLPGPPPELSVSDDQKEFLTTCYEIASFTAFLTAHPDRPPNEFHDYEEPPFKVWQGLVHNQPATIFGDDLLMLTGNKPDIQHLVPPDDDTFMVNMEPYEIAGNQGVSLVVVDRCEECDEIHAQDLAVMTRIDTAGYFVQSWLPKAVRAKGADLDHTE